MSFFNAAIAKSRAKQFGAANTYGSLLSDNPVGETKDFMNKVDQYEILGDAQKDYYKTVGDAQRNFYEQAGDQQAGLADSASFGNLLGGIGDIASFGVGTAVDTGLLKLRR